MIPIVGVSLEEALLGFGGDDDAELHDKEVTLTTSDVTGSQTAIFEYDPQNEPVSGDPAGPWDGYSLFTIDLSGVKNDIEDLQQRISDAETCRQQVIAVLQQYDPDYDPAEGECPASKVEVLFDDYETVSEEAEQCHDCWEEVVATLQKYDPDYNPQEGECPADEIDKVANDTLPDIDPTTGQPKHPTGKVPDKTDFDDWIALNTAPMKDPTRIASNLLEVEFYEKEVHFTTTTVLNCLQMKISWAGEVIWNGFLDSTGTLDAIILDNTNFYWRVSSLFLTCNEEQNEKYFIVSKTIRGDFRVNGRDRQSSWSPYSNNTNRFTSEYTADEINNAIQNSQWTIR